MRLIFAPSRIFGLLQERGVCEMLLEDCLEIDVLGTASSGSVNIVAVASTVLGNKKPLSGRLEEYTDNTTAPLIPAVSRATSAATVGTYNNNHHIVRFWNVLSIYSI